MSSVTSTLTMSALVDEVLDQLYRVTERPRQVVTAAAVAANDTSFDVNAASAARIAETDVLEFGRELMLVTGISSATLTVSRGYAGTTAAAHASGAVGTINPTFPRYQVDREIRRAFQALDVHLPHIESELIYGDASTINVADALRELDANVLRVLEVSVVEEFTNNVVPMHGVWEFKDWLPDEISYTGKALLVPMGYRERDLVVVYECQYSWTDGATDEADTIKITAGGESLPVEYATAKLATGRELSRQEFDQIEEWNQVEAARRGQNIRLIQTLWGRYYQRLDEVKGRQNAPRYLTYRGKKRRVGRRGGSYAGRTR